MDADYISYLKTKGHNTNESLYELVALKWMGVGEIVIVQMFGNCWYTKMFVQYRLTTKYDLIIMIIKIIIILSSSSLSPSSA